MISNYIKKSLEKHIMFFSRDFFIFLQLTTSSLNLIIKAHDYHQKLFP